MNVFEDLCVLIGPEKTSINETILNQHSGDESHHQKMKPDAVVFRNLRQMWRKSSPMPMLIVFQLFLLVRVRALRAK